MLRDNYLPVNIAGLEFKNPFFVASGPTTKSVEQLLAIEKCGWAAASIKLTIDPAPYINRVPRYAVLNQYNALTFTAEKRLKMEDGLKLVYDAKKLLTDLLLMANITYAGEEGISGWVNMAKKFEEAGADIIELNMCCPNMSYNAQLTCEDDNASTIKTGASLGQNGEAVGEIVSEIKKAVSIPLFVKLTPEGGQIAHVAKDIFLAGADVVGGTGNRLGVPPIDLEHPERSRYHLQDEVSMSCFCGSWLKPLACRDTYEIRKVCGETAVISAAGGVKTANDAIEMSMCGADLIGICTETLMNGYGFIGKVIEDTSNWLAGHGYSSLRDVRDAIVPKMQTAQDLTIYGGNAGVKNPTLSSPCQVTCPAGVPIQTIMKKIAEKKYEEATQVLSEVGPMQEICGYLCDAPCERACIKGRQTLPLSIQELEKYTAAKLRKNGYIGMTEKKGDNGKHAAVLSDGIAGLTCAFELVKSGYKVTVYHDKRITLFDMIAENRMPTDIQKNLKTFIKRIGLKIEDMPEHPDRLASTFDAIYNPIKFELGQCGVKEAVSAIDFIRASTVGKTVVIGDGFLAAEAARVAVSAGGEAVVLAFNGTSAFLRALAEEKVPVVAGVDNIALQGNQIVFMQKRPRMSMTMECQIVVNAVESFEKTQPQKNVFTDRECSLSPAQLIACGKKAAAAIDGCLFGQKAIINPIIHRPVVKTQDVLSRSPYRPEEKPIRRKKPDSFTLYTDEQASAEASRCLRCGCGEGCDLCHTICCEFAISLNKNREIVIDSQKCVACGMCYNRCPNKNIEMLSTGVMV